MNLRPPQPAVSNSDHVGAPRPKGVAVPAASQHADSEIVHLHHEISSLRALLAHAQRRLDRERALRATDRAMRASTETAVDRAHRMADLTLERDAALAEIATVRSSKSWRLGAPVRALNRLARRHPS